MKVEDVLKSKGKKEIVTTIRMSKDDKKLLDKKKISPSKIFDTALDDIKEQLKKETRSWD